MLEEITVPTIFSYFLVLCRVGAGVMLMPGISENYISPRFRVMVAIGLAVILTPLVKNSLPELPDSVLRMFLIITSEIIIGLLIGTVAKILLSALHIAGTIISFQAGLAAATFFDPAQGGQSSSISVFLTTLGTVLIFTTGLHHVFITGIADSYALFSPGSELLMGDFVESLSKAVSGSFEVGMKIAAPQIVMGLLLYLGAGVMARLMPQMQIFFVMMPLQIALAFFVLMATLSAGMMLFIEFYSEFMGNFLVAG